MPMSHYKCSLQPPARMQYLLLIYSITLPSQILAQYYGSTTYCASMAPAKDYACSNYVNNGGIDTNRCLGGMCLQCIDGELCRDTGYAPQCGHNLNNGCYMVTETGPFELWSYNFGDYRYQYWHCDELCDQVMPCDTCGSGFKRVGCGGDSEGYCMECAQCGPGSNVLIECYTDYWWGSVETMCVPCGTGTYSDEAHNYGCKVCAPGTYSDVGATSCTPCAAGTYQPYEWQWYCSECEAGSYQPETGASSCVVCDTQPCQVGYYRTCGGASAGKCTECTNTT